MTETEQTPKRPRRDADGRIVSFRDLVGTALAGLVAGWVVLLIFEGVLSLIRLTEFGNASGWIAMILPVWLFSEEFRAVGWGAHRIVVALLGIGFGIAVGMTIAGFASAVFPPLVSGLIGAASLTVVYCAVWFYGMRWLTHRVR